MRLEHPRSAGLRFSSEEAGAQEYAASMCCEGIARTEGLAPPTPSNHAIDIMQLDTKTGSLRPFPKTRFSECEAVVSPDGRMVAICSEESGKSQVYVQPYPGPGMKKQVSINGGATPRWDAGGSELSTSSRTGFRSYEQRQVKTTADRS